MKDIENYFLIFIGILVVCLVTSVLLFKKKDVNEKYETGPGPQCTEDGQCPTNYKCINNKCVKSCFNDNECEIACIGPSGNCEDVQNYGDLGLCFDDLGCKTGKCIITNAGHCI